MKKAVLVIASVLFGYFSMMAAYPNVQKKASCIKKSEEYIRSLFPIASTITYGSHDYCELEKIYSQQPSLLELRDSMGWTLLHEAAHTNNVDLCELLMEFGADAYACTDGVGDTPLHLTARVHAWDVIQFLYLDRSIEEEKNDLEKYPFDHDCALCPLPYFDLVKEVLEKS